MTIDTSLCVFMIVFLFICQANFALQKNQMREDENEGCIIYLGIIIFCICIGVFLLFRPTYCNNYSEYACTPTNSEVYCIECNDGSIEKLDNFWSKLFDVDPCKQNGGVKVYKCRKCL